MSVKEQSKNVAKIFGSVRVHKQGNEWVYLRPLEVGDIKYSVVEYDHRGWLICTGAAISRTTYADLFAVIGTAFGAGDGTTTFNLPDCRGRVLGAIGTGVGLSARALGNTVGAETHTLTVGEMPVHNHGVTDPGHTHAYQNQAGNNGPGGFSEGADNDEYIQTTNSSTTGITINNAGGGGAHNNMQPTEFIGHVFIFAKFTEVETDGKFW
jgi:microcystin-dependent protein